MNSLIKVLKLVMWRPLFLDLKITSVVNHEQRPFNKQVGCTNFCFLFVLNYKKVWYFERKKTNFYIESSAHSRSLPTHKKVDPGNLSVIHHCRRHKVKQIQSREFDNGLAKHSTSTCTQIKIIFIIIGKELIWKR